jgi:hypothetical protein
MKKLVIIGLLFVSLGLFTACKNDNPSVIKVFVRSASNELVEGAKVIIIGDVTSNPMTMAWVDTIVTNNSGFAFFNMSAYYEAAGAEANPVAYFDIIARTATKEIDGYIRSRVHTTAVETVFLPN